MAKENDKESPQTKRLDFSPPQPPEPGSLETAVTIGGVVAFGAALVALGVDGIILSGNIPWIDDQAPTDVKALEKAVPGLDETSPPNIRENTQALCSNCSKQVPYKSMALNEHGYFCVSCSGIFESRTLGLSGKLAKTEFDGLCAPLEFGLAHWEGRPKNQQSARIVCDIQESRLCIEVHIKGARERKRSIVGIPGVEMSDLHWSLRSPQV